MRNLDLNAYGVSEMDAVELRETDGGICIGLIVLVVTIIAAAAADYFSDGKMNGHAPLSFSNK